MLARRKMSVGDCADAVGITPANLSVLKNGRAKAVRFSTLEAICQVLECQPGDVLRWEPADTDAAASRPPFTATLLAMPDVGEDADFTRDDDRGREIEW